MTSLKNVNWQFSLSWLITILVLCGAAGQAWAQQACTQTPQGLVSWWHAEGDAHDIVGTNHGSLENGATIASGKVGRAFSFDGINDFVKILNAPSLKFIKPSQHRVLDEGPPV